MSVSRYTPESVAEIVGGELCVPAARAGVPLGRFVSDSREVTPGDVFVCLAGEKSDGHAYAASAVERGAALCLAEKALPGLPHVLVPASLPALQKLAAHTRSELTLPILAVAGSVGKTTAKEMAASVLGVKYRVYKTPGNANSQVGLPMTLLNMPEDTELAVIEAGISEKGEMDRLGAVLRPDGVFFTNIAPCHLEFLDSLEGVLREKRKLLDYVRPGGFAVLNGDDALLRGLTPACEKLTYGADPACTAQVVRVESSDLEGSRFVLRLAEQEFEVSVHAPGTHLPSTAAGAAAAALRLGLTAEEIRAGIEAYRPISGRAQLTRCGSVTLLDDCYNASPKSVVSALELLGRTPGRTVAVLGDMKELGAGAEEFHREVGLAAAKAGVDLVFTCGELAARIAAGAAEGGAAARQFESVPELNEALCSTLRAGDTVLVKASNSMRFDRVSSEIRKREWN